MVPRLHADPLVDALALPLPAGARSRTSDLRRRERRRGRARPRVRAASTPASSTTTATGRSTVDYAKAGARRHAACASRVRNAGPGAGDARTCCRRCGSATPGRGASTPATPSIRLERRHGSVAEHHELGRTLPARRRRAASCCSATTRPTRARLFGRRRPPPYPKDGINDHVVDGAATVNPDADRHEGGAATTSSTVAAGETAEMRAAARRRAPRGLGDDFDERARGPRARGRRVLRRSSTPAGATDDEARVLRQAFAGMLWCKQFYHYDVERWLDGDPASRRRRRRAGSGRNARLAPPRQPRRHLDARHVGVPVVRGVGPRASTASRSRTSTPSSPRTSCCCSCREWYMHPNGQLPAYEWAFGDVNPPVHAWAALRGVPRSTARRDYRVPRARLPQAAAELHLVGEPQGRRRQQRLRGRLPRARQHRPVRPLGAAARGPASSSSPTAPPGWRCTASNMLEIALRARRRTTAPTRTSRRSSSSTSR